MIQAVTKPLSDCPEQSDFFSGLKNVQYPVRSGKCIHKRCIPNVCMEYIRTIVGQVILPWCVPDWASKIILIVTACCDASQIYFKQKKRKKERSKTANSPFVLDTWCYPQYASQVLSAVVPQRLVCIHSLSPDKIMQIVIHNLSSDKITQTVIHSYSHRFK